ncbi:RNA polymerase sigma factor [Sporolactobacillus inulinus CASD]|uniref:RNA polymerase sigma factor n=1 Tax=Sporolactobacillus inulinus CASD TaxID=1069536 RepID=A0A0U1QP64_9BACL|nr:RNA polymerase sigma factor [Sporolactobacillus inulinus CASD]
MVVDDESLIEEILSGSEAAMEVLARRYYPIIFAFVYRKVGNRELAYDLTQDIFIKMMKKIKSYSKKGLFKSWLFTIAVNHCRDYWKSSAHLRKNQQTEISEQLQSRDADTPFIFEQKEKRNQVKAYIDTLPEMQREVILLKYFHDLKIREIAEVTASNEATVKSRLRQPLAKLRKIFQRGEHDNAEENQ